MNILESDFILKTSAHIVYAQQVKKLTKRGKQYVEDLLNNCPAKHEQEFNNWISGAGMKYKTVEKKKDATQLNMIDEWFVIYLNNKYKENKK